ncbi:hypothetical protein D9619_005569 [Psilocybe cf. subviscida]|uniref:B30.2/SPRY domain-containing protein n=1 Tax=Psilocybe cf. subviscida TaxID=2480587 RepID=A0A8H5FC41_9AGAR|nr:hypothetical protein D9619_005569 [Psilocybe cf. subviscida]
MHAETEGLSPAPSDSALLQENGTPVYNNVVPLPSTAAATASRKRKRAPAVASSPAPSDQASNAGNANGTNPPECVVLHIAVNPSQALKEWTYSLLPTSRADLSSRPILNISRGPIFVPTAEGSEWYKTEMVGVNHLGYRYIPAGINPPGHASACRTIESNPTCLRVSWEDRSPFLKVTKDGMGIAGSKGFRSARCNAPIREGKWYMEVKILHGGGEYVSEDSRREGSHVRLGWGRREAPLNGPVGLDGYSYGIRDKTGEKVTLSRPRPYGKPFGTGDVIGMYISLPPRRQPDTKDAHDPAHLKRERIPIDLKGQEVFEILEYTGSKEMATLMDYSGKTTNSASVPSTTKKSANGKLPERTGSTKSGNKAETPNLRPLPTLADSRIAFFVNGEAQGIAYQDLYDYLPLRQSDTHKANTKRRQKEGVKEHIKNPFDDGTLGYYPFISLFNEASIRLNPGPDFEFPPPDDIDALLDGNPSETAPPTTDASVKPDVALDLPIDADVKPNIATIESEPESGELQPSPSMDEPSKPASKRTWRPACERYPEFMQEEWAFDAREDEEARADLAKMASTEKDEEIKRQKREKKRQQAQVRRAAEAARKAEEKEVLRKGRVQDGRARTNNSASTDVELELALAASMSTYLAHERSNYPSPSPLRQSTAYEPEGSADYEDSPIPTFDADPQGARSGYTTENQDIDNDMDVDQDIQALIDPDTPS